MQGSRARQTSRAWGGTARGFLVAAANPKRSRDLCPQPPAVPQTWLSFKHEGSYSAQPNLPAACSPSPGCAAGLCGQPVKPSACSCPENLGMAQEEFNSDQLLVRAGGHQRPSCTFSCAFMIFEHFVPLAVVEHPASGSLWVPGASWDLPKVGLADGQRSFTSQKGELQMVTVVETVSRVITVQTTQTREVQTTRERKPGPVWGRRAHSWENTLIHFFPSQCSRDLQKDGLGLGMLPSARGDAQPCPSPIHTRSERALPAAHGTGTGSSILVPASQPCP